MGLPTPLSVPHQVQGPAAVPPPLMSATQPPTFPPLSQLAPFSGAIPSIPPRFATAASAGEFVDFNELLHTLELEGTEETPKQIELGEDNRLSLPRKPWKKQVTLSSEPSVFQYMPTISLPTNPRGLLTSLPSQSLSIDPIAPTQPEPVY